MWLAFDVLGRPQTAGSKSAFVNPNTGKAIITESGNRGAKRTWRGDCRDAAQAAIDAGPGWDADQWPHAGPVRVDVVFAFMRPRSHYRTGRNERLLKDSAPAGHVQAPDATKVWRAAEDALTGYVWRDDAQIEDQRVRKVWACRFTGREGMSIRVFTWDSPAMMLPVPDLGGEAR